MQHEWVEGSYGRNATQRNAIVTYLYVSMIDVCNDRFRISIPAESIIKKEHERYILHY